MCSYDLSPSFAYNLVLFLVDLRFIITWSFLFHQTMLSLSLLVCDILLIKLALNVSSVAIVLHIFVERFIKASLRFEGN